MAQNEQLKEGYAKGIGARISDPGHRDVSRVVFYGRSVLLPFKHPSKVSWQSNLGSLGTVYLALSAASRQPIRLSYGMETRISEWVGKAQLSLDWTNL